MKDWLVWNVADGIPAYPEPFKTKELAEKAAIKFRERFRSQGYYLTSDWVRIPYENVEIAVFQQGGADAN